MQIVANDIVAVVREIVGVKPPVDLPIGCYHRSGQPITQFDDWRRPTKIRIGLSTDERRYAQLAYQLGHEMGHVMLSPRPTNNTAETLATALSYEVLDRMAARWERASPLVPGAREYAHNFLKYREETQQTCLLTLPVRIQDAVKRGEWDTVRQYLIQPNRKMRSASQQNVLETPEARALQSVAARALRAKPIKWSHFTLLHTCATASSVQNPEWLFTQYEEACALKAMPELRRAMLP